MRRRSKEPRRISVVDGRAAASLARALMMVSCFIYNNETTKPWFRQSIPEHLFHNCFASGGGCWFTTEIVPSSRAMMGAAPILHHPLCGTGFRRPYAKLTH